MVVSLGEPLMFNRILVTLDGSAYAESAIRYAKDLGSVAGASVILMSVVEPRADANAEEIDRAERLISGYLAEQETALRAEGVQNVSSTVVRGEAAPSITATAQEERCDVVIMSTLGLGAERGHSIGSIALRVLSTSPCPILMIRIDKPAPPQDSAEARWQGEGGGHVG